MVKTNLQMSVTTLGWYYQQGQQEGKMMFDLYVIAGMIICQVVGVLLITRYYTKRSGR